MPNFTTEIIEKTCALLKYINEKDLSLFLLEKYPELKETTILGKLSEIIKSKNSELLLEQLNIKYKTEFLKNKNITSIDQEKIEKVIDLVLKELKISRIDFNSSLDSSTKRKTTFIQKSAICIITFILYNSFNIDMPSISYLLKRSRRNIIYNLDFIKNLNPKIDKKIISTIIVVTNKIYHNE